MGKKHRFKPDCGITEPMLSTAAKRFLGFSLASRLGLYYAPAGTSTDCESTTC